MLILLILVEIVQIVSGHDVTSCVGCLGGQESLTDDPDLQLKLVDFRLR